MHGRLQRDLASRIPQGWEDCPRWGDPRPFGPELRVVPCKVPLDYKFDKHLRSPSYRFNLSDVLLDLRSKDIEVGLVIDLTNSSLYYDFEAEMAGLAQRSQPFNTFYRKIPCKGKGESPHPAAVNHAVWEIFCFLQNDPARYILLHCTHGFNRTGYVMVNAMMRLCRAQGMTVSRAVRRFAESRPPGIYKEQYVADLFKYHHEERDFAKVPVARVPEWKGDDADDVGDEGAEDNDVEEEGGGGEKAKAPLNHEDIRAIGEPICPGEEEHIRTTVWHMIKGMPPEHPNMLRFPGSQPVSLARNNLGMLYEKRYWVTWKADGTRYLLLIINLGAYLIDRSFNVVRCEMRFPTGIKRPRPGEVPAYPVGRPHDHTLLDGEMVVDHDPMSGQSYLRYLVYDCMVLNYKVKVADEWKERFEAIRRDVTGPRDAEKLFIQAGGKPLPGHPRYSAAPYAYKYEDEPFRVRRKEFWPLFQVDKVLQRFRGQAAHETDGLILQGYEDGYVSGTCHELLKWKYADMNSVDFELRIMPDGQPALFLLDTGVASRQQGGGGRGSRVSADRRVKLQVLDPSEPGTVEFPDGLGQASDYVGQIVECAYEPERHAWRFMRVRKDKDTPNADSVYFKVKQSIIDCIEQQELSYHLKKAFLEYPAYEKDKAVLPDAERLRIQEDLTQYEAMLEEHDNQHYMEEGHDGGEHPDQQPYNPHGGSDDGHYHDDDGDGGHDRKRQRVGEHDPEHDDGGYVVSEFANGGHHDDYGDQPEYEGEGFG